MAATLRVIIRSFERPLLPKDFFGNPSGVRLPDTRVVYTVNRSPHIDKKSREQFDMQVKTRVLDIKARTPDDLRKKYFWLKRQRIFGAQYEVQIYSKTRLDKRVLEKLI